MSEEKFASLSSGLLARKGGAKPAMRRQNYINPQGDVSEDLGWNDMGHDDEEPHPVPVADGEQFDAPLPEIRKQMDDLADNFDAKTSDEPSEAGPDTVITPNLPHQPAITDEKAEAPETPAVNGVNGHAAAEETSVPIEAKIPAERAPEVKISAPEAKSVKPSKPVKKQKKELARDKAAFTLRLDKDRHLKLRLASAVSNRSAQQLVTEALDRFLETMPEINTLADAEPQNDSH